jgi:hypothetical protein
MLVVDSPGAGELVSFHKGVPECLWKCILPCLTCLINKWPEMGQPQGCSSASPFLKGRGLL